MTLEEGRKYRCINLVAIVWVGLSVIIFSLPAVPVGVWFKHGFSWTFANYWPLVNFGVFLLVAIWWVRSAKNTFHGPGRTLEEERGGASGAPPATGPAPAVARSVVAVGA